MNEVLTNEVLEALKRCNGADCHGCPAQKICRYYVGIGTIQALATALLEERAKPKDDVWKYASDGTTTADVYYGNSVLVSATPDHTFHRELPKTRARQIAEQEGQGLAKKCGWSVAAGALVANVVESALNKYAEELTKKETR